MDRLVLVSAAGIPTQRSMPAYALPLLRAIASSNRDFLRMAARDALRLGAGSVWRSARELLAEDVRDALASIEAPTLLIWGDRDTLVPPATAHVLREQIPSSHLLMLPGAGHVPMFEQPEVFNDAVRRFLLGEDVGE